MALFTRNRIALLCALPALLVPGIEIPLVLWARHSFLTLHPDYMDDPPTISRAINDPLVGAPFAELILVITVLLAIVVPVLAWAYLAAIARIPASAARRAVMHVLLGVMLLCQVFASFGMVLTTQYTFATDGDLHMRGSYIFFVFQAIALLVGGNLCRMLLHQKQAHAIPDSEWHFLPVMHRFRFRFGLVIAALAILFGILFILKDYQLPVSGYLVQVIYTQSEVAVIGSFVLFIGSYAIDIHHMVRNDKLASRLPRSTPGGGVDP